MAIQLRKTPDLIDVGLQDLARTFLHTLSHSISDFDESYPEAQSAFLARLCAEHGDIRDVSVGQLQALMAQFFVFE